MRVLWGGSSRTVILTRRYAIKLPGVWHPRFWRYLWRSLLNGFFANMNEVALTIALPRTADLCPILFAAPGGLLVVMPRCRPLECQTWFAYDYQALARRLGSHIVEQKMDSFGIYEGRVVAVDYG